MHPLRSVVIAAALSAAAPSWLSARTTPQSSTSTPAAAKPASQTPGTAKPRAKPGTSTPSTTKPATRKPAPRAAAKPALPTREAITTPSGLTYVITSRANGRRPKAGETVLVHYTGTLTDGTKFDSSQDRKDPIAFPLGRGAVIKGWDEGVATMKVGGKRRLVVPPALGYGAVPRPRIPANSTLVFDVELLDVK